MVPDRYNIGFIFAGHEEFRIGIDHICRLDSRIIKRGSMTLVCVKHSASQNI
jgi:hypothetical protein